MYYEFDKDSLLQKKDQIILQMQKNFYFEDTSSSKRDCQQMEMEQLLGYGGEKATVIDKILYFLNKVSLNFKNIKI